MDRREDERSMMPQNRDLKEKQIPYLYFVGRWHSKFSQHLHHKHMTINMVSDGLYIDIHTCDTGGKSSRQVKATQLRGC